MSSITLPPLSDSPFKIFVKSQFCTKPVPPPPSLSLSCQTGIVTGSNCGIGLATVGVLLEYGISYVIIAVRSLEKGEKAAIPLRKAYPAAKIEVWRLDLLSYESIQAFVTKCSKLQRLDKVFLNAGVAMAHFAINPSTGHEQTVQVNYISTALLAILFLPILRAKKQPNSPGRMTIVASGLGQQSKFTNRDTTPLLPSFDEPAEWDVAASLERYAVSKTLVLMLVQKLGETVSSRDVIVNGIEPGLIAGSGLWQNAPAPIRAAAWAVTSVAARSVRQGAWAYLDAATVKGEESHGSLVMNWELYPFHPMMHEASGKQTTERLWDETLEELSFADVRGIMGSMVNV